MRRQHRNNERFLFEYPFRKACSKVVKGLYHIYFSYEIFSYILLVVCMQVSVDRQRSSGNVVSEMADNILK